MCAEISKQSFERATREAREVKSKKVKGKSKIETEAKFSSKEKRFLFLTFAFCLLPFYF